MIKHLKKLTDNAVVKILVLYPGADVCMIYIYPEKISELISELFVEPKIEITPIKPEL